MKHQVQQDDRKRAILTDLIPYEVPLRFSFQYWHGLLCDSAPISQSVTKLLSAKADSCVPYSYWIRTGEGRKRLLGLVHPLLLNDAATLYSDYGDLIVSLCAKSGWSLRKPNRVAQMYYTKEHTNFEVVSDTTGADLANAETSEVGLTAEEENQFQEHASSFFVYEPHNLLQKFFTSKDLLSLERMFSECRRIDVAKCFGSIYTHSVSWAIKGKVAAKREAQCRHTFDAKLDSVMRRSNHGETHGILIGAEFSRIFAEIIFQEIDSTSKMQLSMDHLPANVRATGLNNGLIEGIDYAVRRYIDDYFIFANDEYILNRVQEVIEANLENYKLFVNEKKTSNLRRPFITRISATKTEVRQLITKQLDFDPSTLGGQQNQSTPGQQRHFVSSKIINDLRLVIGEIGVEYPDVSSFMLKHLQNLVKKKLALFRSQPQVGQYSGQWIRCVVEVTFYLFSVDIRFRTSILVSRIVSDLTDACLWLAANDARETEDSILRESIAILKQVHKMKDSNQLEIASFLISLCGIHEYWRIPESLISSFCRQNSFEPLKPDYFTIIAISYFASNRNEYRAIQTSALNAAYRRISEAASLLGETEIFCLSLDMLGCPWADVKFKSFIGGRLLSELNTQLKEPNPNQDQVNTFVSELAAQTWFFDWNSSVGNRFYLLKKELCLGY